MAMEMHNPPHPGESIREDCIKAVGLTVTAAAKKLGVSRQSLSEVTNDRNGISADMAIRLEKIGWGVAVGWLRTIRRLTICGRPATPQPSPHGGRPLRVEKRRSRCWWRAVP